MAFSAEEWIVNAAKERARLAIEEIVAAEIQRKLAAGESISGSKEDIVLAAPIKSAAEQRDEQIAALLELSSAKG